MQKRLILKALQNKKVVNFTKEIIKSSYNRFFFNHKKEIAEMVEVTFKLLTESQKKSSSIRELTKTAGLIGRTVFHTNDSSFWFGLMQQNYSGKIRVYKDFAMIEPYIKGKRVLDFGSDGGHFALELDRDGYDVLTTDVLDNRIAEAKHLFFHKMKNPTDISFKEGSIDTVIIKTVLHHINKENLETVLKKLAKIASRLIIEEDVYDVNSFIKRSYVLQKQYGMKEFSLLTKDEQYLYLVLNDYFTNAVIHERFRINFPFTFHSINEWERIFEKTGYEVVKYKYNGFPDWKLTKNSQAWFVCDSV